MSIRRPSLITWLSITENFKMLECYEKGDVISANDEEALKLFSDLPSNLIHVRVKGGSKIQNLIGFAFGSLRDESKKHIVFTGSAGAISKVISCAEIVKRKLKTLHQVTKVGYSQQVEKWNPKQEDMDTLKAIRKIPVICILLCKDPLDENQDGYQPPGKYEEFLKKKLKESSAAAASCTTDKSGQKNKWYNKSQDQKKNDDSNPKSKKRRRKKMPPPSNN